jgi:tetratricopeptide (TPR) repeat protein
MGWFYHVNRQYTDAVSCYSKSIQLKPDFSDALRDRASLRAACNAAELRNGLLALYDALAALEYADRAGELHSDWQQRRYRQTIAAAYAELGEFETAIRVQRDVLANFAVTHTSRSNVEFTLKELETGKPMREFMGPIR